MRSGVARERSRWKRDKQPRDTPGSTEGRTDVASAGHALQRTLGNQGAVACHRRWPDNDLHPRDRTPDSEEHVTSSDASPLTESSAPRFSSSQTLLGSTGEASLTEGEGWVPSGPGRELPTSVRSDYESALVTDLGDVRVHTGTEADRVARSIHATAFTVGSDIGFAQGEYTPHSNTGERLLAHELVHVVQGQGGSTTGIRRSEVLGERTAAEREAEQTADELVGTNGSPPGVVEVTQSYAGGLARSRGPDVTHEGHYSFILQELVLGEDSEVRIQLYQDPDRPESATFAVWFEGTGERRRVPFTPDGPIVPEILEVAPGVVAIDLTGDIVPELILYADENPATRGVDFTAFYEDEELLSLSAVPSTTTPEAVPESAQYMGELATGKSYYRLFGTGADPRGPRYVDEDGRLVDPGLEAAAETAMRGFAWFAGGIGGIGLLGFAPAAAPVGAKATGAVGTIARGAAAAPLSVKAGSAGVAFAVSVTEEAIEHGIALDEYDWGSIGLNSALGWISGGIAHAAVTRWPAPILSRPLRLGTWQNLGRQQIVFSLYGTCVALVKSLAADSDADREAVAEHAENILSRSVNEGRDEFLRSERGRRHFPNGSRDPRIQAIDKVVSYVIKLSVNRAMADTDGSQ